MTIKAKELKARKKAVIHFKNGQEKDILDFSHVRFVKDSRITEFITTAGKVKTGVPESTMEFYEIVDIDENGEEID
jgi:hypothetical protein